MEGQNRRRGNRRRLPPLERKFGYFHCYNCRNGPSWTSAHVYCVVGTFKVFFKQLCKSCGTAQNPFRVRNLQCPGCGWDREECECVCDDCGNYRNECGCEINANKPHRSDLCMKCRSGWPCKNSYDDICGCMG